MSAFLLQVLEFNKGDYPEGWQPFFDMKRICQYIFITISSLIMLIMGYQSTYLFYVMRKRHNFEYKRTWKSLVLIFFASLLFFTKFIANYWQEWAKGAGLPLM